jgi:hypothetical protein
MNVRISTRFVPWATALAVFSAASTWGLTQAPEAYQVPVFDTLREIAPLQVWASVWAAVGVAALVAAVTRRSRAWIIATTAATFVAIVWWSSVTWEAWINGARLSWTGWALWFWFAFTNVRVGFAKPFEKRP